ncbi:MAG: hypothetical protein RJA81_1065 [Planctomycetota bacterium]|jgi:hypothetical protein
MPKPKFLNFWCMALLVASAASFAQTAHGQATADEPKATGNQDDTKAAASQPAESKTDQPDPEFEFTETYRDPRVDDALSEDLIKELAPPRPTFSTNEERQVMNSAGGRGENNPRVLKRFVTAKASDLTNRKSIEAMLSGEGSVSSLVRPIEAATMAMVNVSKAANAANNSPFMVTYTAVLIETLQPLLKSHLITRVQAAIVLASTGSLDVNPTLLQIIADDEQPWQMKLIAVQGVNNAIQYGRRPMAYNTRTQITVAMCNLLRGESDIPWFIKSEACNVIGNLRIISEVVSDRKVEPAELMMSLLVNSGERAEVRLEAARALALMEIPSQFRPFNLQLVAASVGQAVVDSAKRISAETPSDSSRGQQLVALLANKLPEVFLGDETKTASGLQGQANSTLASRELKAVIDEIFTKVKDVTNAGSQFVKSRGQIIQARRTDFLTTIDALEKVVIKNQPQDRALIKGGETFELETPAETESVANSGQ